MEMDKVPSTVNIAFFTKKSLLLSLQSMQYCGVVRCWLLQKSIFLLAELAKKSSPPPSGAGPAVTGLRFDPGRGLLEFVLFIVATFCFSLVLFGSLVCELLLVGVLNEVGFRGVLASW